MRVIKWLDEHLEEILLVIIFAVMVGVIFTQVVMRMFGHSLSWSEELGRYCFIWLVYLGISYGVKKQRHIKVDVMLLLLKGKARISLNILANLIFLVFCFVVVQYGFDIATKLLNFGQKSPALHIPMGIVYMATPIGMGLSGIRIIQNLIIQFKTLFGRGELEEDSDLGHLS